MLTKQEIFDKVATHLLTQGERAWSNELGGCAYRGIGGLRCAVGCLIPDESYDLMFEGHSPGFGMEKENNIGNRLLAQALNAGGVDIKDKPTMELLGDLQGLHDGAPIVCWSEQLDLVAKKYGLKKLEKT